MGDRYETTYAGLLQRLTAEGYLTGEAGARVPRILECDPQAIAHAAHEFVRWIIRRGRLNVVQGGLEPAGGALVAADGSRGLRFVLPALSLKEPGLLRPTLDPSLGPPPELSAPETWRLFNRISCEMLTSVRRAADVRAVTNGLLDLSRELLAVPAALFSARNLPIPGGIARGPQALILGSGAEVTAGAAASADHSTTLPPVWNEWIRRAAESPDSSLLLHDFARLPAERRPAGEGSAVLLPLAAQDPTWTGVLAAVSDRREWFDEERLARARLLLAHVRRTVTYAMQLQSVVSLDFLTGAYNRGFFEDQVLRTLAGATRRHQSFALLIIDIDDFKVFNTRLGYDAGDAVLRSIAQALRRTLRSTDVLARYGGEEFAAILAPPVSASEARQIGERLREAAANAAVAVPNLAGERQGVTVTVSVGGALFPGDGRVRDELWSQANQMLLAAKNAGKNRVCFPSSTPSSDAS
ncbi:MAG: GGDEF domain-containing protein [Candidatus Eisenbacteria sp.]|nr:GGDEF domain-containing protein [Candidatus Eisenbacteria bacterium]